MSLVDSLLPRLRTASRHVQIALAAECGDRVYPIYEEYWSGVYSSVVRRAVEIGWSHACGESIDEQEIRAAHTELEGIVDFYDEDEFDLLARTVGTIRYLLSSLSSDAEESTLSVARALIAAQAVARFAESLANQGTAAAAKANGALHEEKQWQDRALTFIDGRKGPATRGMFDDLVGKAPNWLAQVTSSKRAPRAEPSPSG
jgi:hypothetical protein